MLLFVLLHQGWLQKGIYVVVWQYLFVTQCDSMIASFSSLLLLRCHDAMLLCKLRPVVRLICYFFFALHLQGYSMMHSAYGYGNETVLCNDPHANPFTDLDDAELVQQALDRNNIDIKICRIGPWVFPIEVTTCFLPKGRLGNCCPE